MPFLANGDNLIGTLSVLSSDKFLSEIPPPSQSTSTLTSYSSALAEIKALLKKKTPSSSGPPLPLPPWTISMLRSQPTPLVLLLVGRIELSIWHAFLSCVSLKEENKGELNEEGNEDGERQEKRATKAKRLQRHGLVMGGFGKGGQIIDLVSEQALADPFSNLSALDSWSALQVP